MESLTLKRCTECGEWKPRTEFYKCLRLSDGLLQRCKQCHNTRMKRSYERERAAREAEKQRALAVKLASGEKRCIRCGTVKPFSDFYGSTGRTSDGLRGACKECVRARKVALHPPSQKPTATERFARRVQRAEQTGCLVWNGSDSRSFWYDGDTRDARHFSLMMAGVELIPGMKVVDTCGNDRCVEPAHLIQKPRGNGLRHDSKVCSDCGKGKPLSEFSPCASGSRGRYNWCKECARTRKRKQNADGRLPRKMRFARLGLTEEQAQALFDQQSGLCAICGGPGGVHGLGLDHDHDSGIPRQWLCGSCNTGIAMLKHDPELIRVAASYVEKWDAIIAASTGAASTELPIAHAAGATTPNSLVEIRSSRAVSGSTAHVG